MYCLFLWRNNSLPGFFCFTFPLQLIHKSRIPCRECCLIMYMVGGGFAANLEIVPPCSVMDMVLLSLFMN